MRAFLIAVTVVMVLFCGPAIDAQTGFAGTWTLDPPGARRSR